MKKEIRNVLMTGGIIISSALFGTFFYDKQQEHDQALEANYQSEAMKQDELFSHIVAERAIRDEKVEQARLAKEKQLAEAEIVKKEKELKAATTAAKQAALRDALMAEQKAAKAAEQARVAAAQKLAAEQAAIKSVSTPIAVTTPTPTHKVRVRRSRAS